MGWNGVFWLPGTRRPAWTRICRRRGRAWHGEKAILKELHDRFVTAVKEGRGDRLQYYAAADLAAEAQCTSWPSLSPAALAACWPNRIRDAAPACTTGAGLFDGSVHGALTALKLGLVDDVVEETFPEAMKQDMGVAHFPQACGRDRGPCDSAAGGACPLWDDGTGVRLKVRAARLLLPGLPRVHTFMTPTVAPKAPPAANRELKFSSRLINSRLK